MTFSAIGDTGAIREVTDEDLPPPFTLNDLSGNPHTFDYASTYKGKITILLFFATWCKYCIEEIPYYQKLYNLYKDNPEVAFLAVSTFRRASVDMDEFVAQHSISFPLLNDTSRDDEEYSKVAKLYEVRYVPFNLIYDKTGAKVPTPSYGNFEEFFSKTREVIDQLLLE